MWKRDDSYDLEDNTHSVLAEVSRTSKKPGKGIELRLINFVVDTAAYCLALLMILEYFAGNLGMSLKDLFVRNALTAFITALIAICVHVLFYTIIEASTRGRSLGKLVTGTQAVESDGSPLCRKSAGLRSICRLIPLEGLWALWDVPLHDKLTRTRVVKN